MSTSSVRVAVIADSGTGDAGQLQVAAVLTNAHRAFPFELVLMLGDNLYGDEDPDDYREAFERPYGTLLASGVVFHAALGHHDDPSQRFYRGFNMGGERHTFCTAADVSCRTIEISTAFATNSSRESDRSFTHASLAAEAIVWAADTGRREVYVAYPTVFAIVGNKIAPGLADRYVAHPGIDSQMTDKPEDPDRPHNLWTLVDADRDFGTPGRFDARAREKSWQMWLSEHRRTLLAGAAAAALAFLAARAR